MKKEEGSQNNIKFIISSKLWEMLDIKRVQVDLDGQCNLTTAAGVNEDEQEGIYSVLKKK